MTDLERIAILYVAALVLGFLHILVTARRVKR